jgi:hypothetical protein
VSLHLVPSLHHQPRPRTTAEWYEAALVSMNRSVARRQSRIHHRRNVVGGLLLAAACVAAAVTW